MNTARRLVVVAAAAMLLGACASGERSAPSATRARSAPGASTTSTGPSPASECPRTGTGRGGAIGDHAVGRADRTVVDTSRPTSPSPALADRAAPTRTLPLVVLYPARGAGGRSATSEPVAGAKPTGGPYPVLVYSHGLGGWGDERVATLTRWASAGFVVVAPTFPLSSRSTDPSDLMNQPADVAFVVQQIRAAAGDRADLLHGLVRTDCVALGGHSLGGGTTMAAAYDTCCTSIRPEALVDIAGVLVERTGTAALADMAPIPTLLVHGDADHRVPYDQGRRKLDLLHGPTWMLTFTGGGHSDMFQPPRAALLDDAVVAFLDAELQGEPGRLDALPGVVAGSGLGTLQTLPRR